MGRVFLWIAGRHWRRHKVLALLDVISIAVGIAAFLSIQIVNQSALAAFRATLDLVAGKANRQIRAVGAPFKETIYPKICFQPGVKAATPLIEAILPLTGRRSDYLRLLGVDPFSNGPFQTFQTRIEGHGENSLRFFFKRNAVLLAASFARNHHLRVGDTIRVEADGRERALSVAGLLRFEKGTPGADEHLAVMDIANAQELLGKVGRLDRINLIVADSFRPHLDLPPNAEWGRPRRRGADLERMLSAFQLNLTALSLIAIFVGLFLIYNTVTAEVIRRRREIGILRALGMTPWQVQRLFLGQAFLSGGLGIAMGLLGGIGLAKAQLASVTRTISSFYVLVSVQRLYVPMGRVWLAVLLGLAGVGVAAWKPSWEAARLSPTRALSPGAYHDEGRTHIWRWLASGMGAWLLGAISWIWVLRGGPKWLCFVTAFLLLLGLAGMVPGLTYAGSGGMQSWAGRILGGVGQTAISNLRFCIRRVSVAVAALSCALAMMIGLSIMIFSFRQTIRHWVEQTIRADVYISPASQIDLGPRAFLPRGLVAEAGSLPGVAAVDTYREIRFNYRGEPVRLGASRFSVMRRWGPPEFVGGDVAEIWHQAIPGKGSRPAPALFVSEHFARRFHRTRGDLLAIPTPAGRIKFRIAGVYRDYTTDVGTLLVDQSWFDRFWGDSRINGLALYLKPGAPLQAVMARLRARPGSRRLSIYSNRALRRQIFQVFDQTFAITDLLRWIALGVAVLGIFLTLTILVAERFREIGILRSLGATPRQIKQMVWTEAGLMGGIGYGIGLFGGLGLAALLTFGINRIYFGWTIQWHWPAFIFLETPLVTLAAAWAAGWLPAREAAACAVAEAIQEP